MKEKEHAIALCAQPGLSPPPCTKRLEQEDVFKEAGWNLAALPQSEDDEEDIPKNKFLPKKTEAIMVFALCTALFGEYDIPRLGIWISSTSLTVAG